MKTCSSCKISKEYCEFTVCSRKKDGFDPYCKSCRSAYYKERNYDRSSYQAGYKRKVTSSRKEYLKKYQKQYKILYRKKTVADEKIYKIVRRVLAYKSEQKVMQVDEYLGWSKKDFIDKLGPVKEGYHLDHKIPITWFVKETPVSVINSLENLQYLPADENMSKLNRYCHVVSDSFLQEAKSFINPKYLTVL